MQSSRFSVSRLGNVFSRVSVRSASSPNLNRYPHTNTRLCQFPCTDTIHKRLFHGGLAVGIPNSTDEVTSIIGDIGETRVEITPAEDVWLEPEEKSGVGETALGIRVGNKSRAAETTANTTAETKAAYIPPAAALFHWLDLKSPILRRNYFESVWPTMDHSSIHSAVLRRLNPESEVEEPTWIKFQMTRGKKRLHAAAYNTQLPKKLRKQGITQQDIEQWVWILSGGNAKEMLDRFLDNPPMKDHMLLMRILRWDIQDVRSLRKVILHVWEHILRVPQLDNSEDMMDPVMRKSMKSTSTTHGKILKDDDMTFMRLISLLLYHVRRIWPSAMPGIANMLIPYSESILADLPSDCGDLDAKRHRRLCNIYNSFLRRFALPASINPLESMAHNWNAQRKLLEFGGQFQPPLVLDERSYRAITTVLAASKKTARESKVTTLRSRDWPPWRMARDGMDAQSTPHEDSSRVLLALEQKAHSGYAPSPRWDSILRIVGGQELDGTPTIHTRSIIKPREARLAHQTTNTAFQLDPAIWARRIVATRDVQEAWSAFVEYQSRGGIPTQAMYFQMFVKLHSEKKRQSHAEDSHQQAMAPGDGREVMEVAKNNFSLSYQSQLEPPSVLVLYRQMISSGILPSGRCLNFLIQRASSITYGFDILLQSRQVPYSAWLWLSGKETAHFALLNPDQIYVSDDIIFAVTYLLCRFSPNAAKLKAGGYPPIGPETKQSVANPLSYAASLLKQKLPMFRPAWYTLFRGLAKKDVVISRDLAGDPKNCILAWRALMGTFKDFHGIGLELDPEGFRHICSVAFNTLPVLQTLPEQEEVLSALALLKGEFGKLVEVQAEVYGTPGYLNQVSGYDLHLYIRVMGITGEYEEILGVLRWVVANYEYLRAASLASSKERRHMRKFFVAVRMFLMETEYVDEAKNVLQGIPDWEGWVSEEDVEQYVRFHEVCN